VGERSDTTENPELLGELPMNRKIAVVGIVGLLLGAGISALVSYFIWKPSSSKSAVRSEYVISQLDVETMIKQCKPPDSKYLVHPTGGAEEDRYGFHGFYVASWADDKSALDVAAILQKSLADFLMNNGCQLPQIGTRGPMGDPKDHQEWMMQFEYHHPATSVGGRIFLWIYHEKDRKWTVVISYYAAHDLNR
jgi:hypothetical protein